MRNIFHAIMAATLMAGGSGAFGGTSRAPDLRPYEPKHDPDKLAKAEAKRQRKAAKLAARGKL